MAPRAILLRAADRAIDAPGVRWVQGIATSAVLAVLFRLLGRHLSR